eukprot:TRINITY_DN29534_c0_g1_i1.p1 TRINITY_DN29534_c0_g1~~TRINITY_DN29534_c0_g1_i1.p1  ORF type:complete len:103 (+),score=3.13 TRINITY_DN29534_c0_g1_i1:108-416(+)
MGLVKETFFPQSNLEAWKGGHAYVKKASLPLKNGNKCQLLQPLDSFVISSSKSFEMNRPFMVYRSGFMYTRATATATGNGNGKSSTCSKDMLCSLPSAFVGA